LLSTNPTFFSFVISLTKDQKSKRLERNLKKKPIEQNIECSLLQVYAIQLMYNLGQVTCIYAFKNEKKKEKHCLTQQLHWH
jgi:hypothetical protein